jgi:hypothetical protein
MKTLLLGGFGEENGKFGFTPSAKQFDKKVNGKLTELSTV